MAIQLAPVIGAALAGAAASLLLQVIRGEDGKTAAGGGGGSVGRPPAVAEPDGGPVPAAGRAATGEVQGSAGDGDAGDAHGTDVAGGRETEPVGSGSNDGD